MRNSIRTPVPFTWAMLDSFASAISLLNVEVKKLKKKFLFGGVGGQKSSLALTTSLFLLVLHSCLSLNYQDTRENSIPPYKPAVYARVEGVEIYIHNLTLANTRHVFT